MNKLLIAVAFTCAASATSCAGGYRDVSEKSKYKQFIGQKYEIIADLDAYGVRENSGQPEKNVILIPGHTAIGGPEIGFVNRLAEKSKVTITGVSMGKAWLGCDVVFVVKLEEDGKQIYQDLPVMIEMLRGNEHNNCTTLNPEIYRRINNSPSAAL